MSLIAMRSLSVFLSFSVFSSLATTAAIATATYRPLSLPVLNADSRTLDAPGPDIDPRFGIRIFVSDELIDQISSIMVAINAMADLALPRLEL